MAALPSDTIKFSDLRTHFVGDTNPVKLSDYYPNASANLTAGLVLPLVNNAISMSSFRGKTLNRGRLLRRRILLNSGTASSSTAGFDQAFGTLQYNELITASNFTIPANDYIGFEYTG